MDYLIFEQINNLAGKSIYLDSLAIFSSEHLGYILIIALVSFMLVGFKKHWLMVKEGLIAAIVARFAIVEIIRFIWQRPRPFIDNQVTLLIDKLNEPAFPSGHAAFYFALSSIVYFYNKKVGIVFFIASLLVSISRVYAGIHWPADILAGAVVGVFTAWLVRIVFKKSPKN